MLGTAYPERLGDQPCDVFVDAVPKLKPSVLAFDMTSPDAPQQVDTCPTFIRHHNKLAAVVFAYAALYSARVITYHGQHPGNITKLYLCAGYQGQIKKPSGTERTDRLPPPHRSRPPPVRRGSSGNHDYFFVSPITDVVSKALLQQAVS